MKIDRLYFMDTDANGSPFLRPATTEDLIKMADEFDETSEACDRLVESCTEKIKS